MYLSIIITVLTCVRVLSGVFKGLGVFFCMDCVCVGMGVVDRTGRSRLFTYLKIVFMDSFLFFVFFMSKLITPRTC